MRYIHVLVLLLWGTSDALVFGHAAMGRIEEGAVGVRFFYEGGAPMRSAEVAVRAPAADEERIIEGLTDRNGCFAFVPDQVGEWRVEANDGMGHRVQLRIEVDAAGVPVATASTAHGHHIAPWVVAIAVLFGLFGIWALWIRRPPTTTEAERR